MATVDSGVPVAFQNAINQSEMQRQSDEGLLLQKSAQVGTTTATSVSGNESFQLQLALKQASVRDFQRRIAICAAFGQNDGVYREGLRALGVGGGI
jgi:hypothetical protein